MATLLLDVTSLHLEELALRESTTNQANGRLREGEDLGKA